MGFEDRPDDINKNGRPKGSPNKTTQEIRDAFQCFVEDNTDKLQDWLERVAEKNPAKAIELMSNLSEYILPKLSRTEVKAEVKIEDEVDLSKLPQDVIDKLLNEDNANQT
jgi:hypothetical protein